MQQLIPWLQSLIWWVADVKTVQDDASLQPANYLGIYTQAVGENMLAVQGMMYDAIWQDAPKTVHSPKCGIKSGAGIYG